MSARSYLITLSLTGTAVAVACLLYMGGGKEPAVPAAAPLAKSKTLRPVATAVETAAKSSPGTERPVSSVNDRASRIAPPASAPAVAALSPEARAAKVEQEANHDLRRLVTLLDLDEAQQEKVFQTLAKHSPHWTPEMLFAPAAAASGKRTDTTPGLFIPGTDTPAKTAPVETAPSTETAPATDALEEIMGLLDPDQQTALLEDEMDRTAWWAEVLPQILPADEVPAIDGTTPANGAGTVREYEGSDVLE